MKNIRDKVIKSGPIKYLFNFFKEGLPQILLGQFLNTFSHTL